MIANSGRIQDAMTAHAGAIQAAWTSGMAAISAAAQSMAAGVTSAVMSIPDRTVTITTVHRTVGAPGRAEGGPVAAGSTYLVGERGPEYFTPSSSGSITPNDELPSARKIGEAVARALRESPISIPQDAVTDSVLRAAPAARRCAGGRRSPMSITSVDIQQAITDGLTRAVTYSIVDPSGGVDGDWWLPGPPTAPGIYRRIAGAWQRVAVIRSTVELARALETLSGADRLDASAVKNLPTGGGANIVRVGQPVTVDFDDRAWLALGRNIPSSAEWVVVVCTFLSCAARSGRMRPSGGRCRRCRSVGTPMRRTESH